MNALGQEILSDLDQRDPHHSDPPKFQPQLLEATELLAIQFPEMKWAIAGLIPEGASLLAGAPKMGKSWLAMNLALAVCWGGVALGSIPVERGPVVYLALEDSPRRLQGRLRDILGATSAICPQGLTLATRWAKYRDGGLDAIAELIAVKKPRLLIIDTLERVRNPRHAAGSLYADDYESISVLQELGLDHHLAIIIITHVRKQANQRGDATDPLEEVSGSLGLTGAADVVLVLKRPRHSNNAKLFLTGRDVEEKDIALRWDQPSFHWQITDDPTPTLSPDQRQILDVLQQADRPMGLFEIIDFVSAKTGKGYDAIAKLVSRMARDGAINKTGHGQYMSNLSKPSNSEPGDNPYA